MHHPPARRDSAKSQRSLFWDDTAADRSSRQLQEDCPPAEDALNGLETEVAPPLQIRDAIRPRRREQDITG
jgi:hypothetical protein